MPSRVETLFKVARAYAARALPWIGKVRVRFCRKADSLHKLRWRLFAHTEKLRVYTVCFARDAEQELTDEEILGMTAHELGHVVGMKLKYPEHSKSFRGTETPKTMQDEADRIAREVLGFSNLRYNKRSLQELVRR